MLVNSDWVKHGTVSYLEKELSGFKFVGCGLYVGKDECTLVIPHNDGILYWGKNYPDGQIFVVYHYSCKVEDTFFNSMVPTFKV